MTICKNQKEGVKELRAWARQNGYVMRKCGALLGSSKAYKLYNKVSYKSVSNYFTLDYITSY